MSRIGRTSLFAVTAAFVTAASMQAQTASPDFGLTAGINMSTISGGTVSATGKRSYRPDFMIGASVIYPVSEMLSIQPELLYSRQGVKVSDIGAEGTIKINYLTVPVLFRLELGDAKAEFKPAVYAGPYVAKKFGCSGEFKAGTSVVQGECASANIDAPVKNTDFGATVGGEISLGTLAVFARFSMGLTSIDDSKSGAEDIKNRVITIGGRWSFDR